MKRLILIVLAGHSEHIQADNLSAISLFYRLIAIAISLLHADEGEIILQRGAPELLQFFEGSWMLLDFCRWD